MSKYSSTTYHQDNKERVKKKLVNDIKVFLKKEKKQQYGPKSYKNLSEDEKQKLVK